ncbi:phage tail tube protein [Citrobacter sp. CK180]|nr:phage tail tube protein [Citrobacter sp. CK180]MDM3063464.1 phage tail tube protein [Citrobacter sp. CK180]
MSSGAKVVSAFIRETTPGVTPSGPWSLIKRSAWGVKPTQNTNDNDEIGGTRMAQGMSMGTVDVGGDVSTKFRWGQHDAFLASCFGADWAGDTLTMGNDRITFSLATYATDVGIGSISRGAQVGVFQMEVPNDGDITATVTFAALGWESNNANADYIIGDAADDSGELRYTFKEVSAISLNGVSGGDGFCIDTFSIQFDNNIQTQRCIGTGSPFAGANIPTTFTPSGSITLSWSKDAWEVWSKTLTGATVAFSFTLANDEGQYTFNFPKVQVAGDWPDGGNTDIIQVQLDITAADESPTITRAVTIPATGITVTPETASVDVGDTTSLTATLAPAGATDTVTWESSDPEVATVSASGVVTGVAAGTATITAKVRTFTDTATITVTEP